MGCVPFNDWCFWSSLQIASSLALNFLGHQMFKGDIRVLVSKLGSYVMLRIHDLICNILTGYSFNVP